MRRSAALMATLGMLNATGCYSYVPVAASAAPKSDERIRVTLTSEGTVELARFLGPRVVVAEGQLSSVAADGSMAVAVDFVQTADGIRQPWMGEGVVTFPSAYLTAVQQRTLLVRQSVIASIAVTAGVIALAVIALKAGGARGADGNGGGQPPP